MTRTGADVLLGFVIVVTLILMVGVSVTLFNVVMDEITFTAACEAVGGLAIPEESICLDPAAGIEVLP